MPVRPRALAALLALAIALAGCLQNAAQDTPAPAAPGGLAAVPVPGPEVLYPADHDHADPLLHALFSDNMGFLAYTDLSLPGVKTGANGAIDIVDGHAYLAQMGDASGFVIVNVSDPAAPRPVGHFSAPNVYGADIKASLTGDLTFLATQPVAATTYPSQLDRIQKDPGTPLAHGIYVVNTKDKAKPVLESVFPARDNGAHTVHYHKIGGREYVFICSYKNQASPAGQVGPVPAVINPPWSTVVTITEVVMEGGRHVLKPVSEYTLNLDDVPQKYGMQRKPHELSVAEHPVDGKTYAYVSYWDEGLRILDVTDPAKPREAGAWTDFDIAEGNVHYSAPFPHLIHGKHITIVGPEFANRPQGTGAGDYYILDTTDVSKPVLVANWTLPGSPDIDNFYRYSPHNFDLVGTTVVSANYHAGVWAFDVDDVVRAYAEGALATHPDPRSLVKVVGYYFPHAEVRSHHLAGGIVPNVWGVLVKDGTLFISDIDTGLHVVGMAGLEGQSGPMLKGAATPGAHQH